MNIKHWCNDSVAEEYKEHMKSNDREGRMTNWYSISWTHNWPQKLFVSLAGSKYHTLNKYVIPSSCGSKIYNWKFQHLLKMSAMELCYQVTQRGRANWSQSSEHWPVAQSYIQLCWVHSCRKKLKQLPIFITRGVNSACAQTVFSYLPHKGNI